MKHLFSLTFILLTVITLHAQQPTNFSGSYRFDDKKTDLGGVPSSQVPSSLKAVQDGDKLTITRTQDGSTYTENFANGAISDITLPSGAHRKASLTWNAEKTRFTVNSNSITPDGQTGSKIVEIWSLSADGKMLTLDRNVTQANGLKYDVRVCYEKQ